MNYPELRDAETGCGTPAYHTGCSSSTVGTIGPRPTYFSKYWPGCGSVPFAPAPRSRTRCSFRRSVSDCRNRPKGPGRPAVREAGRIYAALIEDFSGVLDTDYARARLEQLRGESAYRQAEKKSAMRLDENGWLVKLDRRFVRIRNAAGIRSIDNAVNDWCKQIAGFRHRRDTSRDADERSLYHRLHEFVWRRAYEGCPVCPSTGVCAGGTPARNRPMRPAGRSQSAVFTGQNLCPAAGRGAGGRWLSKP